MAKSLFGKNLDLDDVEFIAAVEAAFGIAFRKDEPETWSTFGDVFDATCRHVRPVERGPVPCLSATAFRRIRKAIPKDRPGLKIHPDTPLASVLGDRTGRAWCRALQRETGLQLPDRPGSVLLFFAVTFGAMILGTINGLGGWVAALAPILGLLSLMYLRPALPVRTVGELARGMAALNPKTLSQPDGAIRTRDVWSSLVFIVRDVTAYEGTIDRKTALVG
jgi:hypothetical protein